MPKYGINKAVLLGNVGTEPELRYLDGGIAVCNFRLATTERYKTREGAWADRTEWHTVVLWRQKAEIAQKMLHVGSGVYVEGRITTRSWDGPDGQKRYKTEIEAETVRLLDPAPEGTLQNSTSPPSINQPKSPPPPSPDEGDDLPF